MAGCRSEEEEGSCPEAPKARSTPADEQQKAKALNRWENEGGAKAKTPKRPRDVNQRARRMVDIATGEVDDVKPLDLTDAQKFAQAGGLKGGRAQAEKLTPERRAET
jgi:hypothetical protein